MEEGTQRKKKINMASKHLKHLSEMHFKALPIPPPAPQPWDYWGRDTKRGHKGEKLTLKFLLGDLKHS